MMITMMSENGDGNDDDDVDRQRDGKRENQRERQRGRERARERERDREGVREETDPARRTLKITIGRLCRGPSKRFRGACRLDTHTKPEKKLVPVSWSIAPPLARTYAKHL